MEENTQETAMNELVKEGEAMGDYNTVETPVVVPVEANKTEDEHDHTHDEDIQTLRKIFAPLHHVSDKERRRRRLANKRARLARRINRQRNS